MVKIRSYEDFQTVPVVDMDEMTPYLQVEASDGKSFPLPGEEYNFIRLDLSLALIRHPDIIAAYFEGSFILCRLHMQEEQISIQTDEEIIALEPDMEFAIWGVVKDLLIPR